MDVLAIKEKNDPIIYPYIKVLKINNNEIDQKGTSSLKSQKYFSDYDLFSDIKDNLTNEQIYDKLMHILNETEKLNDLYFIELKIQNLDGSKKKFFKVEDITKEKFINSIKHLNFIKLDYVVRINNNFIEMSIIYQFNKDKNFDIIKSIKDDIKDLKKENNYYKVLKRYFNLMRINKNKEESLKLTKFFNTDIGKLYQNNSILKAIKLLLDNYDDDLTIKKVLLNLKDLRLEPNLKIINKTIKDNDKIINSEAKKYIKNEKLKI